MWRLNHLCAVLCALSACEGVCPTAEELQTQLDAAEPGDTVRIGACSVGGSLRIPAGVALEGVGQTSVLSGATGSVVILEPSADAAVPTRLASVSVESTACVGLLATDVGTIRIDDVRVEARRGVAIGIEGLTRAELTGVEVIGSINADELDTQPVQRPPFGCVENRPATHGVVLMDVENARLEDVTVDGFAAFGAIAIRSGLDWLGGHVSAGLGVGVEIWAGQASLSDLELTNIRHGESAVEAFNLLIAGQAVVDTSGLVVRESGDFGVMQAEAMVVHQDLLATDNVFAGAWTQQSSMFELRGDSMLDGNGFAGVAVYESQGVEIVGANVQNTQERVRIDGVRTIRAADGLHLVQSAGRVQRLQAVANVRVGILLDLGGDGSTDDYTLDSIVVDGDELGAVAQNGMILEGWDAQIQRQGMTAINDEALSTDLVIADAVGPPCFPPIDELQSSGLRSLIE